MRLQGEGRECMCLSNRGMDSIGRCEREKEGGGRCVSNSSS